MDAVDEVRMVGRAGSEFALELEPSLSERSLVGPVGSDAVENPRLFEAGPLMIGLAISASASTGVFFENFQNENIALRLLRFLTAWEASLVPAGTDLEDRSFGILCDLYLFSLSLSHTFFFFTFYFSPSLSVFQILLF
jgi:hypothetical protein